MKREAFKMYLKAGSEKEYQKRHSEIWPELVKLFGIKKRIYCMLCKKITVQVHKIWERMRL